MIINKKEKIYKKHQNIKYKKLMNFEPFHKKQMIIIQLY